MPRSQSFAELHRKIISFKRLQVFALSKRKIKQFITLFSYTNCFALTRKKVCGKMVISVCFLFSMMWVIVGGKQTFFCLEKCKKYSQQILQSTFFALFLFYAAFFLVNISIISFLKTLNSYQILWPLIGCTYSFLSHQKWLLGAQFLDIGAFKNKYFFPRAHGLVFFCCNHIWLF